MECTTITSIGVLQWKINNGPVAYTIDSTVPVNDNTTINDNVFVYSENSVVASANVYTSTASLNTSGVTSVQCFDGGNQLSLPIQLEGKHTYMYNKSSSS